MFPKLKSLLYSTPAPVEVVPATTAIPGFPLEQTHDDARSVLSSAVSRPSAAVATIVRRIRTEGLSNEPQTWWVDDDTTSHCFDCQSIFTTFRRKHHCRICGQVFCGRCASNLIPSARFGSQGVVRVCNLCLSIMDRRETTHPPYSTPHSTRLRPSLRDHGALFISSPLEASARPPQSQFAASHLFPRADTPYAPVSERGDGFGRISERDDDSRAPTPDGEVEEEAEDSPRSNGSPLVFSSEGRDGAGSTLAGGTSVAPFRKALEDDPPPATQSPPPEGLGISISGAALPPTALVIPGVGRDDGLEAPKPSPNLPVEPDEILPLILEEPSMTSLISHALSLERSPTLLPPRRSNTMTVPSLVEFRDQVSSSFTLTHGTDGSEFFLSDLPHGTPDPRDLHRLLASSRPHEGSGKVEIPPLTMQHVQRMLRQSLGRVSIPTPRAWESELMKLLVLAVNVAPDVRGGEDAIDPRRYVHIKKLPGGRPRDSEYIPGVLFTKNILHKRMPSALVQPKIMLLSFALEYQRVETQLMSLEPLLKQEREYLRNLVGRIVALRPSLVLVERNVSRLALEYLLEAGVAVARNVKKSVMRAVARATRADLIDSMDQLALSPRLGRCANWRTQTFVHSLIPGRRKTLMRIDGCGKELFGTLLLRGGTIEVLRKVKGILKQMVLVVYSAQLEGYLLRDELVLPVVLDSSSRRPSFSLPVPTLDEEDLSATTTLKSVVAQTQERTSASVRESMRTYQDAIISGSPHVRFLPPYPVGRMCEEDLRVAALRRLREYEETEQILREEEEASRKEAEVALAVPQTGDTIAESLSTVSLDSLTSEDLLKPAPLPVDLHLPNTALDAVQVLQTPSDLTRAGEYEEAEENYALQLSTWNAYVAQQTDSLDARDHDALHVLETLACTQTDRLCAPPVVRTIPFYGETDVSLGQYIDEICRDAGKPCAAKGCDRPLLVHYKTWVHGSYRVMIIPEVHVVDLQSPELVGEIVMWSYCKLCATGSAQTAMSAETYRFSLAKYLELCFYPQDFVRRERGCEHNSHTDHVRFWMVDQRITCQITVERIDLRGIVGPRRTLRTKPETGLLLRNEEYLTVLRKSTAFWDSNANRIAAFNFDVVPPELLETCKNEMEQLAVKSELDRRAIIRLLVKTYELAQSINGVLVELQNKAVEWEAEWTAFEGRIVPNAGDKDVRRMTTVQLKRLFSDNSQPISPERRSITSHPSSVASSSPTHAASPTELASFDGDSDSTIYGLPSSPYVERRATMEDTSEGETDADAPKPSPYVRPSGVANLVKLFDIDPPSTTASPRTPTIRRTTDKQRIGKDRGNSTGTDVSDGGYAAHVGVAHLAQSPSVKPSRIPLRSESSTSTIPSARVATSSRPSKSASTSRSGSRPGSGATTPSVAVSGHRLAAEGSSTTIKPSRSTRSTLKGKSTAPPDDASTGSDRAGRLSKQKAAQAFGLDRPSLPASAKMVGGRRVASSNSRSHVSNLAAHFNDKARLAASGYAGPGGGAFRGRRARPVAQARPTVQVFDNVKDAVREDSDSEGGASSDGADDELDDEAEHDREEETPDVGTVKKEEGFVYEAGLVVVGAEGTTGPSLMHERPGGIEILPPVPPLLDALPTTDLGPRSPSLIDSLASTFPRITSDAESSGNERGSIIKAISNLWSYRGADFAPLEWPLAASEHLFADNPILVREDEPSSILAFMLSSKAYRDKLRELDSAPRVTETFEPFMPDETHVKETSGTWDVLDFQPGTDVKETFRQKPARHFRLQFEEGTTNFFCKIFFAEEFDALRRECGCESQFIESLSRCVKWDSSGGKSKVDFLKTRDDRFIVKEISRLEMDALLKFAPDYFDYMSKAFFHRLPTVLAKIFGFYRIGLRNPTTGKVVRLDVLVTENLFYERKLTQVFDLKGSTRNRHVQPSNKPNEVLLDENLVEISYKNPLYVREGSKRFIKAAVFNDSLFLSNLNVMDYSLVVGVDSNKNELVVGIVDFIRTYTWDKKLESWVKDSTFLGGGSKPGGPTIVTPKQYKTRFREAMNGYFLLVPDPWLLTSSLAATEGKLDAPEVMADLKFIS